jgi:Flp pilus assembly protein TadG
MPRSNLILKQRRARNSSGRRGTTVLEFAFVGPIVLLLFFGLLELGRGLMVAHLVTNAARAGCRTGIIEGTSNSSIRFAVNKNLRSVGLPNGTVTVEVNDVVADAVIAQANDEITVIVSIPSASISWAPFQRYLSGALSGQYTLRRE